MHRPKSNYVQQKPIKGMEEPLESSITAVYNLCYLKLYWKDIQEVKCKLPFHIHYNSM
jgi:hypothetical protein